MITGRDPDTVRGADFAYHSHAPTSQGPAADGLRPRGARADHRGPLGGDRWREIHEKIAEYLRAGVVTAVVLDPGPRAARVFGADEAPRSLGPEDELTFPGLLEGFRARVGRFFD